MSDTHAPEASALGLCLDRASPRPLYQQLAEQLRHAVDDGRLAPGTALCSETKLAQQTGLSRITVRQAVQRLADDGVLVRRRGVATYVADRPDEGAVDLAGLHDDLRASGDDVLRNEHVPASAEVAAALAVPAGSTVARLERLPRVDGVCVACLRHYLPAGRLRLDDDRLASTGLHGVLRAAGITVRTVQQSIGARNAGAQEGELLGVAEGSVLVTMRRTLFDRAGRAVEYADHCYPAARRSWEFRLLARREE
ncbi:GntR family transcriptional regulator [Streptomyces sp. NPDC058457]|uniref:GntR family transcriptional regulator n=1 Tax=Streptomyces sp. NPDC058457 TaxID=3346507 RepID=UPI00364AD366